MTRNQHDRTRDHMGVEPPDVVVLDADIGPFHAGQSLVDVLEQLAAYLQAVGLLTWPVALDAVLLKGRTGSFTLDANMQHGFLMRAVVKAHRSGSFTLDADIERTFSINAFIQPYFTIDAVLA